jgi:dTDP-glucose 4,6-dehydratase
MSKKVLVTGGLGFIGSNLIRELNSRGYETLACDLMHSWQPNYLRCDVSKFNQVVRLFTDHDFDYVYHLAVEYN